MKKILENKNKQKENEKGRLLPIDEENTQLFSSDVYEKKYTSEKMTSRLPYSGRSMIEMLGVLAIIGVLSVGGIAGYSKAMYRYRLNKTIEEITQIAGNVRAFFAPQKSYKGLTTYNATGLSLLKKAKLVPDEMWEINGYDYSIVHPFGDQVTMSMTEKIYNNTCMAHSICLYQAFSIHLFYLPQEACIDLISQDWSDAGVSMIGVWNDKYAQTSLGNIFLSTPVNIETAIQVCSTADDDTNGVDRVVFYFDVDATQGVWADEIAKTRTKLNAL